MNLYNPKFELAKIGDRVTTFRGESGTLEGWAEPRHYGSTGHVYVKISGDTWTLYPGVIGYKFMNPEDPRDPEDSDGQEY